MELKAENVFTVTEDVFKEGMRRIIRDEYGPMATKALAFLVVVWVLMTVFTFYMNGNIVLAVMEFVVIAAIAAWMELAVPHRRAKKGWEAAKRRSGEGMTRRTLFYEDRLEVEAGAVDTLVVNYEDVRKTLTTKNLLIIINCDKVGVMVALDGFKLGDKDTVLKLIKDWTTTEN